MYSFHATVVPQNFSSYLIISIDVTRLDMLLCRCLCVEAIHNLASDSDLPLKFTYGCKHGYVTTQFLYIGARDCEPYGCREKDSRGKSGTCTKYVYHIYSNKTHAN